MARRRIIDEPVNHERWLVSYADFITLLFAFFVVMYSISQVNDGKYKVLSETLSEAFTSPELINPQRTLDPFQIGEIAKSNPKNLIELESSAILDKAGDQEGEGSGEEREKGVMPTEFEQINSRIDEDFADLIKQQMITLRGNEEWLEVELKSSLLFASGDAKLSNDALELLGSIADILRDQSSPIRVEGFTDNVPINTVQFPSNWELSTARAAAVVQLFVEEQLQPGRLAAIGYGEHQPIADNATAEGRNANRRVVLMISKTGELRPELRQLTSTEQLLNPVNDSAEAGRIEILIPGVDTFGDEEPETANDIKAESQADPMQGIKTIELEDGGLLFTNDSAAESAN
ncbi:flagellar motor protein MotD [Oceanicoccus sp. KOV_DT_Chl]|uniref:flagellar motor protein MotD n=1 Tax=Oceanicoccus sp. KOV_DT_Chl TaxID=1904639 RepID=UPI000C7C9FE8|nr:flagellar motor protein MotD [Oceanicoccus sp. KOV_DT_Chl]